jgi:hypothetical protein
MARCFAWGAAALVMAMFGSPAWATPRDARDPSSQVKARASARGKRVGPEIAFATVGMGATIALSELIWRNGDRECGHQIEIGYPESDCRTKPSAQVASGATLLVGFLLLPPAGAAIGGVGSGGSFGYSVLGALVGLAGGILLAVPALKLDESKGIAYSLLGGGVVAGSVIGYELSVPRSDAARASLLPKPAPLRIRASVLSEGAALTLGGTF